MPRGHATPQAPITTAAGQRGIAGWATRLRNLLRSLTLLRVSARQTVPRDLLADVLADNGLRAREQDCRRARLGCPKLFR